jgi:hypothetical protein
MPAWVVAAPSSIAEASAASGHAGKAGPSAQREAIAAPQNLVAAGCLTSEPTGEEADAVSEALSIVITNYNYAAFVADAITSALAQCDGDIEVIVVDDGSTDGSRPVIESFGPRITALFTTNEGQGAAFNRGFAASAGDVVIFLDADDVLWSDTGSRVVSAMAADHDVVRVQFALDVIDREGRTTGATVPSPPKVPFAGDARQRLLTCPDDIVWQPTSGNAFRRHALHEVLPMPAAPFRLCADYYLSNLVPLHGTVSVLERSGGGYRVHGGNAHYSPAEDPDRLRSNIRRTYDTHRCLIAESHRLGMTGLPTDPAAVPSVSAAANRLLSYRLDRGRHPLPGDSRRGLVSLGVSSSAKRTDVSPLRRLAFAGWFVAMAVVPRRWVRTIARPFARLA